jgi:ABC-type molybdenum transport system ATPase subunit/photorepair protein PhrA
VVLVTHHDDEVLPCLDREMWLRDGRVVRSGARAGAPGAAAG